MFQRTGVGAPTAGLLVPSGEATLSSQQPLPCLGATPALRHVPAPSPLTVADVVVSVAHTQVAPAVLHAVAAVRTLGVHVAGCGCDFCGARKKPCLGSSWGPGVLDKGRAGHDPVTPPRRPGSGTSVASPVLGWGGVTETLVEGLDLWILVQAQATFKPRFGG